ncbi:hypothetical protein [Pedobacter deserti]|uniref:hypothetical protein n=1 Tax=Pedobacter deserti TaxID=2817382 RepID=UPI00210BBCDB|nr:hypothetical protein [Pedobacter sp. SYSU D00382]
MEYIYLGDRQTASVWRGQLCRAVRIGSKCVRGRNGAMLVEFEGGSRQVIIGRLLRKINLSS